MKTDGPTIKIKAKDSMRRTCKSSKMSQRGRWAFLPYEVQGKTMEAIQRCKGPGQVKEFQAIQCGMEFIGKDPR